MRLLAYIFLALFMVVGFSGCSGKEYFDPEKKFSASSAATKYDSNILNVTRDGATLENTHYIGKSGLGKWPLGKGYVFVNEDNQYILASDKKGNLKVINKSNGETKVIVALHTPVVGAAVHKGNIVYLLSSNVFGIYEIETNRKVTEHRSDASFAVDTRIANPMFVDDLFVVPTLDGKLLLGSVAAPQEMKMLYISSAKTFNNVTKLGRIGDTLVAATPSRAVTFGTHGQTSVDIGVSDISTLGSAVYLFDRAGEIYKMDEQLNVQKSNKFKFAQFVATTAFGNRLYALDQTGLLIVSNLNLTKSKVYDVGKISTPVFMSKDKLYKDNKIISLKQLGYE